MSRRPLTCQNPRRVVFFFLFGVRLCVLGLVLFVSVSDTAFARMAQDPGMVGSPCAQQSHAPEAEAPRKARHRADPRPSDPKP